jgi:hypothetical protein
MKTSISGGDVVVQITPPKNEHICTIYTNSKGKQYICTANQTGDMFFLYEIDNNKLIKTKNKSKNPLDFDTVIFKTKLRQ